MKKREKLFHFNNQYIEIKMLKPAVRQEKKTMTAIRKTLGWSEISPIQIKLI
ncbi:hypothetical protein RP726_11740 [Candidatus Methylospira mobilis]|uniref:hypothetical protein n=1 Tax=Candidatus Methylospira mobilis TaxID=1808979 RepID=UPI00188497A1|nr:hypothetical protein [Candidatus Methylospira mobilis]WNV03141.1 hypothetical protein RP726_11740 [Candidatus Methylospira mobilis]